MKGLLSPQGICCMLLSRWTRVFNMATGCTRHSGSPSVVETASLSLNSMEFFMNHFYFILFAHSLISVQAPEIVCDSSNSTLSAQVYLNTTASFGRIVPDIQEWSLSQWLPLLMRTYSLTHSVCNLVRTVGKSQVSSSFFLYLLLLLGSAAVLFTWITPKFS